MTLLEKYKPKTFSDLKGKDMEIARIKIFLKNFPKRKAIILYGPAGTGKTSLAYCFASETKSEIIELNASDLRNKEQIEKIMKSASEQQSLFEENKILLIDEIDGINRNDRGGLPELIRIISNTPFPIIMTANKIWDKKFSGLRKKSELLEVKELDYRTILEILKYIAEKENLMLNDNLLTSVAIKCKGDVRAAINDLQTISYETEHDDIHERDREETIFNTMRKIFKELPNKETLGLYDKVNMPLDEILLWLEENLPKEYEGEELYKAFEAISKADVFRGRIYRQQHWRFLVYQNFFLSAGIASAKKQVKQGFTSYKRSTRILKIWLINQKYQYKKSIAEKYAKVTHTNKKRAMREFPIIKNILKNQEIRKKLELNEKEIEFLNKI